jgi:hypothetical protein
MRTLIICLSIVAAFGLVSARASNAADSPVHVEFKTARDGKPPMRFYSVKLTLTNSRDKPVWFLLPYWADEPLVESGMFKNKAAPADTFGGKRMAGDGGAVVEIRKYGDDGFKAFRLPANARVELDGYDLEAWKDVHEMTICQADALKVNGTTPLEKWLPYGVLSADVVKVSGSAITADWKNLDWDAKKLKSRTDYPQENVEEIKAEGIRRWTVKWDSAEK